MRLAANLLHLVVGQSSRNLKPINLRQARGIFENAVGELAIAGEQHQPRGGVIEAADGKNPAREPAQYMTQSRAALGIRHGGDDVNRLVQNNVTWLARTFGDAARGFDAVAF